MDFARQRMGFNLYGEDEYCLIEPPREGADYKTMVTTDVDILLSHPTAEIVECVRMNDKCLAYLAENYGRQIKALMLTNCTRINDLSPIEQMPELEYVVIVWNQRADRLWDMSRNPKLRCLSLQDFTRLKALDGIEKASALRMLDLFTGGVFSKWELYSLNCLSGMKLHCINLGITKLTDESLGFLEDLPELETFDFPPRLFDTKKVAWVYANLPEIQGRSIGPYESGCGITAVGKRGREYSAATDKAKIKKCVEQFNALVEDCRGKSYAECFGE